MKKFLARAAIKGEEKRNVGFTASWELTRRVQSICFKLGCILNEGIAASVRYGRKEEDRRGAGEKERKRGEKEK